MESTSRSSPFMAVETLPSPYGPGGGNGVPAQCRCANSVGADGAVGTIGTTKMVQRTGSLSES